MALTVPRGISTYRLFLRVPVKVYSIGAKWRSKVTLTRNGSMIVLTGLRVCCWPLSLTSLSCWWTPFVREPGKLGRFGGWDAATLGKFPAEAAQELVTKPLCPDINREWSATSVRTCHFDCS